MGQDAMIPFAPGFFKPIVPAAVGDITCEDTWGIDYYTEVFDTFGTDGDLDGASPEISPNEDWVYASASAVKSGGSVSPANFTASGTQLAIWRVLVSASIASGETLTMTFPGYDSTIQVVLALGAGEASSFSINFDDPDELDITDTFSIGTTPGEITVGFDCGAVYNEVSEKDELRLYLSPNFSSPVATLVQGADSFPDPYMQCSNFEFACTGSNTAINFIRICALVQA
jgi:hypothetical protein